jgi:threonine dehydrogenase-like Zn-dependent dehydrogenase
MKEEPMQAAILTAPFNIVMEDRELPPLQPTQVRVRMQQCGICASDIALWRGEDEGKLPAAIGHEIAGIVTEVGGQVSSLHAGDHVAALVDGGGFAEEAIAEERHCVAVCPSVSYPAVAEPLACAISAVERAAPALGDDVVIIGAGFMGSLIQSLSMLKGARSIIVADIRPDTLARAHETGATRVVDASRESAADAVHEICRGGADVTYEITGVNQGLEIAGKVTRMSGKLCIVAYHQGGTRTIPLSNWNWMAFNIINAHLRDRDMLAHAMRQGMRLVNAGILDVSALVTDAFPLRRIADAFDTATAKPSGFIKAIVEAN